MNYWLLIGISYYIVSKIAKTYSSEIRGLCLMKWPSETLQNLSYFWNTNTHLGFCDFFISYYFIFSLMNALHPARPWSISTKKTTWIFLWLKYGKIWSVSLGHFIKHKPLISEECSLMRQKTVNLNFSRQIFSVENTHKYFFKLYL